MAVPPRLSLSLVNRAMRPTPRSLPTVPEAPRDCVREFPTLSQDTVSLVSFDGNGKPRYIVELDREEDLASWHVFLLRRTRKRYGFLKLLG